MSQNEYDLNALLQLAVNGQIENSHVILQRFEVLNDGNIYFLEYEGYGDNLRTYKTRLNSTDRVRIINTLAPLAGSLDIGIIRNNRWLIAPVSVILA